MKYFAILHLYYITSTNTLNASLKHTKNEFIIVVKVLTAIRKYLLNLFVIRLSYGKRVTVLVSKLKKTNFIWIKSWNNYQRWVLNKFFYKINEIYWFEGFVFSHFYTFICWFKIIFIFDKFCGQNVIEWFIRFFKIKIGWFA